MVRTWCFRILAVLLGVVGACALLVLLDFTYGWIAGVNIPRGPMWPPTDPVMGWKMKGPTSWVHSKLLSSGNKGSFSARYTFDSFGRRVVPGSPENARKSILLFGGSNMFGYAMSDDEMLATLLQKEFPRYRVYNYAYLGYGPQHMFIQTQDRFFPELEVRETPELAVYLFFPYHVYRVHNFLNTIRWAHGMHPVIEMDDQGNLVNKGPYLKAYPVRFFFMRLLSKSRILHDFKVNLPISVSDEHLRHVCAIFQASRNNLRKANPDIRMLVILAQMGDDDRFERFCLEPFGFEHFSVGLLAEENLTLPQDGHLSAKGVRKVFSDLRAYLQEHPLSLTKAAK